MMKYLTDVISFIFWYHTTFLGMRYNTLSLINNFFNSSIGIKIRICRNIIEDLVELFFSLLRPGNSHLANRYFFLISSRSEERRVGKECSSARSPYQ